MYDDKNTNGEENNELNNETTSNTSSSENNFADEVLNNSLNKKENEENSYKYNSQQTYNTNQWEQPYNQNQQQTTQWTFNDYGPMSGPPKKPHKDKKEKKPRSANHGLKVFAVVMSVLLVVSIAGFGTYIAYDMFWKNDGSSVANNQTAEKPSLKLDQTPDTKADKNNDGVLSGKEINDKVSESVVGVAVYSKGIGYQLAGQGSGIVMTKDGYVITNAHVVSSRDPNVVISKIEVILKDGTTHEAKLIGADIKTDIAVLKVTANNLVPAEFGDSDKLSVGDRVSVIGNPSGIEFAGSFTQGVVSSLSRNLYMSELDSEVEYIQTDAAINPGNSGGAFINEYGQVVGISSAKLSEEGYEGMGFAIPINNAKGIIDSLVKKGYVAGRPKIGIQYRVVTETLAQLNGVPKGLRVYDVQPDSDAYAKGVLKGDIIFKMDDKDTYDASTLGTVMKDKKPGDKIVLTIYRVNAETGKAATIKITVKLGEMTPQKAQ